MWVGETDHEQVNKEPASFHCECLSAKEQKTRAGDSRCSWRARRAPLSRQPHSRPRSSQWEDPETKGGDCDWSLVDEGSEGSKDLRTRLAVSVGPERGLDFILRGTSVRWGRGEGLVGGGWVDRKSVV